MRTSVLAGVWVYMIISVLAEVAAFYLLDSAYVVSTVVMTLASSQAVAIVTFYMDLKGEPGIIKLLMLVAVMFLSGLLIATIASLG